MYAVITTEGRLAYLGECQDQALATFNSKEGASLHQVDSPEELNVLLGKSDVVGSVVDRTSETFNALVQKLDEIGLNKNLAAKVADNGHYLLGEARSLGVKGMKAVGEGFVALGELLRKASDEEKHKDCCGGGCSAEHHDN
jgi:hypothetical protein